MKLEEDIKPVTYLKNNASQLVRSVSERGRTVTITQSGEDDRWRQAAILMKLNANTLREWEPQHGFREQEKAEQLKVEQAQKAALARNWWKINKDKVEFISGQWRLPKN